MCLLLIAKTPLPSPLLSSPRPPLTHKPTAATRLRLPFSGFGLFKELFGYIFKLKGMQIRPKCKDKYSYNFT